MRALLLPAVCLLALVDPLPSQAVTLSALHELIPAACRDLQCVDASLCNLIPCMSAANTGAPLFRAGCHLRARLALLPPVAQPLPDMASSQQHVASQPSAGAEPTAPAVGASPAEGLTRQQLKSGQGSPSGSLVQQQQQPGCKQCILCGSMYRGRRSLSRPERKGPLGAFARPGFESYRAMLSPAPCAKARLFTLPLGQAR